MTKSEAFIITACTRCKCFPDAMLPDFLKFVSSQTGREITDESDLFDEDIWLILSQKNCSAFQRILAGVTN